MFKFFKRYLLNTVKLGALIFNTESYYNCKQNKYVFRKWSCNIPSLTFHSECYFFLTLRELNWVTRNLKFLIKTIYNYSFYHKCLQLIMLKFDASNFTVLLFELSNFIFWNVCFYITETVFLFFWLNYLSLQLPGVILTLHFLEICLNTTKSSFTIF